jgi:cell division protein FtsW
MKNILTSSQQIMLVDEQERNLPLVYASGLSITVSLMLLFGLTMLYSTSYEIAGSSFFIKQIIWACLGTSAAIAIFFIGYQRLSDYSLAFIGAVIIMLLVARFFFPAINGAHRWIKIPHVGNIQPSEFAKLAIVLYLSKYCSEKIRSLNQFSYKKGFLPGLVISGSVVGLVLIGKDLGTTALLATVILLTMFIAGLKLRYFLAVPPLLAGAVLYLKKFDLERWSRMTSFLDPEKVQKTDGYQLWNSLMAFGSGNWFGLGFAESRLKAKYLPEAHTDFILSIVGEELGFLFILLVILAYISFMYFAIRISMSARNRQGMLLGFGITAMISLQAIINIGVVSGSFPTKGMPAPFISYGGSNLIMCLMSTGLLISIAVDSAYPGLNRDLLSRLKHEFKRIHPDNWL